MNCLEIADVLLVDDLNHTEKYGGYSWEKRLIEYEDKRTQIEIIRRDYVNGLDEIRFSSDLLSYEAGIELYKRINFGNKHRLLEKGDINP